MSYPLLEQAVSLHRQGRLGEARALYLQIQKTQPDLAEPWHLLGVMAHQLGKSQDARELISKAIQLDPAPAKPHYNLGIALQALGALDAALNAADQALKRDPADPDFQNLRITALMGLSRLEEAAMAVEPALAQAPDHPDLLISAAIISKSQKKLDQAEAYLLKALAVEPTNTAALCTLGGVNKEQRKLDQAIHHLEKALQLQPDMTEALTNLAVTYKEVGRLDEAIRIYRQLLEKDPGNAGILWNMAHPLLLQEKMQEGLKAYEYRFEAEENKGLNKGRISDKPYWDGHIKPGLRLIAFYEQGLGDIFQFMRYCSLLQKKGLVVYLLVPQSLKKFLAMTGGVAGIIGGHDPLPDHDVQVPLLSLPHLVGTTMETIPAEVPYIRALPAYSEKWRDRLKDRPRPLIGICWQGNPDQNSDRKRSFPLKHMAPIIQSGIGTFVNLHKGSGESQIEHSGLAGSLLNFSKETDQGPDNFLDTSGLIDNLDLVISVCTSVAHLSGAMGKETWVMLTKIPDWRWYLDRSDSPWYPTARLFRQDVVDDWSGVIAKVEKELVRKF